MWATVASMTTGHEEGFTKGGVGGVGDQELSARRDLSRALVDVRAVLGDGSRVGAEMLPG